uniref:Uncharacterized protein n=1 Tax=uncultured verrucomicrobium HF0500_16O23 TaxID=723598 RepID=E7C587_9BACT|nr:hypothetical protein [uncultured verrucomicrobium HF0500_16O23]
MAFDLPQPLHAIFNTPSLPNLGPERRAEALPLIELENELESAVSQSSFSIENADLARSAALLWHDHLDASHTLSQAIRNSDGSFLHGIMHRREPDYPNAKYWFNRVGTHDTFPEIFNRAKTILTGTSLEHLVENVWDPFVMVDSVSQANSGSEEYNLLQQIQKIEFEVLLLESFCN